MYRPTAFAPRDSDAGIEIDLSAGKFIILHVDDIGMFESTVDAFFNLRQGGLITSGSIMPPCPFASRAAERQASLSDGCIDLGVHLTLTCEWPGDAWRPLSDLSFSDNPAERSFSRAAWPDELVDRRKRIGEEFHAQLQWAYDHGIDVTHLDTHMLTAWHPQALDAYLDLGLREALPTMTVTNDIDGFFTTNQSAEIRRAFATQDERRRRMGAVAPLPNAFIQMPLADVGDRLGYLRTLLQKLPKGITHFSFHPALPSGELRASAADWEYRVADYELLSDASLGEILEQAGVTPITYKYLRRRLRRELNPCGDRRG